MSVLPRIAMTSATFHPFIISVSAYRLVKEGARIYTRYGVSPPSLTTYIPSVPRGDSVRT